MKIIYFINCVLYAIPAVKRADAEYFKNQGEIITYNISDYSYCSQLE